MLGAGSSGGPGDHAKHRRCGVSLGDHACTDAQAHMQLRGLELFLAPHAQIMEQTQRAKPRGE